MSGFRFARSHLAFLIGLTGALAVMWRVRETPAPTILVRTIARDVAEQLASTPRIAMRPSHPLTAQELEQARIAWRYFEHNTAAETGMVNAADKYPSTTLWDLGSYMMAVLAARDLGILDATVAHDRLDRLIGALARLPLVERVPNKAYNTQSLAMVDYTNHETPGGIGWSAIDIARLSVPMTITVWRDPDLAPKIRAVLAGWALDQIVANGRLQGTTRRPTGALERVQEGRLGYEQYAARALSLLGLDVERAARWDLEAAFTTVSGQRIAYDARAPETHSGTHNAVVSEPFLLIAIELGLGDTTRKLAESVYLAQRNRARELGRLVAASEDNIDRPPYFVYNSVLNGNVPWAAFSPDGADASAHRSLSTKAAFGWGHLYDDEYANKLLDGVSRLSDPERGWYSGVYDADGKINTAITANTNGVLLEVLWYRVKGPLLPASRR